MIDSSEREKIKRHLDAVAKEMGAIYRLLGEGGVANSQSSQSNEKSDNTPTVVDSPQPKTNEQLPQQQKVEIPPSDTRGEQAEKKVLDGAKHEEEEEIPVVGKEGYFDGVFLITEDEKKYQLPPNYISKSLLVTGDRLKIIGIDETGSRYSFKQIHHIERKEIEGILTKKENQWAVHSQEDQGIYFVVAAAVRYYGGDIGDKATVIVPAEETPVEVTWAALKSIEVAEINKESAVNRNSVSAAGGGQSRAQQDKDPVQASGAPTNNIPVVDNQKPANNIKQQQKGVQQPAPVIDTQQQEGNQQPTSAPTGAVSVSNSGQQVETQPQSSAPAPTQPAAQPQQQPQVQESVAPQQVQVSPSNAPEQQDTQVTGEVHTDIDGNSGEVPVEEDPSWELR